MAMEEWERFCGRDEVSASLSVGLWSAMFVL